MDPQTWLQEDLAALTAAAPIPDPEPGYGELVEERARRRTRQRRWAIRAGMATVVCLASGGYLVAHSHDSANAPDTALGNPVATGAPSGGGSMAPGCAPAWLLPDGGASHPRITARVDRPIKITAHLGGDSGTLVWREQLVVMPPGYEPAAPGRAESPNLQVAASNTLRRVRPAGQRVRLTWTPTSTGRYPLIDVGSGVCDPAEGRYQSEGDFGVIIVGR